MIIIFEGVGGDALWPSIQDNEGLHTESFACCWLHRRFARIEIISRSYLPKNYNHLYKKKTFCACVCILFTECIHLELCR